MADYSTLSEAASAWLSAGLRPIEQFHTDNGGDFADVTVKFTWRGQEYEVSVRALKG